MQIDIFGEPPTPQELRRADDALHRRRPSDPGIGVMMAIPVPIVDVLAGAAVSGIHHVTSGETRSRRWDHEFSRLRYVDTVGDWSSDPVAAAYAAKVQAMGRPLVRAEAEALEERLSRGPVEQAVSSFLGMLGVRY